VLIYIYDFYIDRPERMSIYKAPGHHADQAVGSTRQSLVDIIQGKGASGGSTISTAFTTLISSPNLTCPLLSLSDRPFEVSVTSISNIRVFPHHFMLQCRHSIMSTGFRSTHATLPATYCPSEGRALAAERCLNSRNNSIFPFTMATFPSRS
jgi:hypothetical protein